MSEPTLSESSISERNAPKPYLEKDFSVELNYKLWTTKGARFVANRRLRAKNRWSTYSIGALSVYVICLNLLVPFGLCSPAGLAVNIVAFASTAMSVVILVFSQLELSRDYSARAAQQHMCALEIGEIYNALRQLKTSPAPPDFDRRVSDLNDRYSLCLRRFANHEAIDFNWFRISKNEYFHLKLLHRWFIAAQYYLQTYAVYQAAIVVPPFLFVARLASR